ncbi:MAG: aminopeptidase, partial [Pyrinomonadaceae bacterium]|nr:aminopeptidase [Sphingobacteriaceae bacterium]
MKNLFLFLSLLLFACQEPVKTTDTVEESTTALGDKHSLTQPDKAIVKHLELDLKVNFDTKVLTGKAVWTIENLAKTNEIIFDTRNLNIDKVTLGDEEKATTFEFGEEIKFLGKALKVKIEPG